MNMETIWNICLTTGIAVMGWIANQMWSELNRVQILLNRTREEMNREFVTKNDVHNDINRVIHRIDTLENKIDRLMESQQWDGRDRRG
jgi:flagellar hook-associated protein FlgK